MHEIDLAIIAAVEAEGVTLYNGAVPTDNERDAFEPGEVGEPVVVTVEFPYAVLYSNFGDDYKRRLAGRTSQRSKFFQISCVGLEPEQAQWVARRVRRALKDRRLEVTDPDTETPYRMGLIDIGESQRLRRDDTTTDPNGNPAYYLVDTGSVKVSNKR